MNKGLNKPGYLSLLDCITSTAGVLKLCALYNYIISTIKSFAHFAELRRPKTAGSAPCQIYVKMVI